ncbi:hypothetical protein [Gluconobacter oxydans]|nr:hypothetical protein [Gluconobacter oxydans]
MTVVRIWSWHQDRYVLNATLTEKRIRAVVGITPVNLGRLFREGFSGY